jgi:hypothetical protein
MTWADDMQAACERGNSPVDADYILAKIRAGEGMFWAGDQLHGSVVIEDGELDVGHMFGVWNDDDARPMWAAFRKWAKDRGIDRCRINGRPGWARFLRMKGYLP